MPTTPDYRDLHVPGEAAGGVLWFDGTNWSPVAAGTSGQILKSNGASAPTWLTASSTPPTGTGIVHITAGAQDGASYKGIAGQFLTTGAGATDTAWATLSGDATASTATPGLITVAKINGASVPAAGSLVTGNAPYVSGTSALTYSALNLAGGSGWVTGLLPLANLAAGSPGTVLIGPGPAFSATPSCSAFLDAGTPSTTGILRVSNNVVALAARNNANSADISLVKTDANDNLILGDATHPATSIGFGGSPGAPFALKTVSISIAGLSSYTLTSAQIQNGYVVLTGVLTSNCSVFVPLTAGAVYVVDNNTTGAFAVLFGGSSGWAVWCPPGQSTIVRCDGTNYSVVGGWGQPFQMSLRGLSLICTSSSITDFKAAAIPLPAPWLALRISKVEAVVSTTIVGGIDGVVIGTASGGNQLLSATIFGAASVGTIIGDQPGTGTAGSDMVANRGYEARYTNSVSIWYEVRNPGSATTAGAFDLNVVGYFEG